LSSEDKARLNEILHEQPEAREQYHQYLDVHEGLQANLAMPDFSSLDTVLTPEPATNVVESAPTGTFSRALLAMAALIVIGLFINFLVQEPAQPPVTEKRADVKPIAKVRGLSGSLVFTGDRGIVRSDLNVGAQLVGGTIEGMTPAAWFELEFKDGSVVTISGNSILTFSDDGQKKLRLQEGGFSANVKPQPKDKPMLVSTRTALFEVMGTRFSVDTEPTAATLRVSEGRVRATRLSDNLSVEVPAKHRVVASQDHELTPERLPDSISIWESRLERGAKGGNGDWVPAQGGEPAHLRAISYTIDAKIDTQQRTIYTISTRVSGKDSPPVILKPGSRIRVQGRMETPHAIWFGVTLRSPDGDFAGHFQIIVPAERFQPGETFDVTLNPEEYHLDPSLKKWAADLAKNPFDLKVGSVWCHSLWDSVGLQVSKMEILAPKKEDK
jgi:ferric-dicitrate binding protein FerR (iron transport regulator)